MNESESIGRRSYDRQIAVVSERLVRLEQSIAHERELRLASEEGVRRASEIAHDAMAHKVEYINHLREEFARERTEYVRMAQYAPAHDDVLQRLEQVRVDQGKYLPRDAIEERFRNIERLVYLGVGGVAALEIVLQVFTHLWK
jgi:hypothetical protein